MKKLFLFFATLAVLIGAPLLTAPVSAQNSPLVNDLQCNGGNNSACDGTDKAATTDCRSSSNCNVVNLYLNPFIKLLSILVGVAVVLGIIIGGIQYAASGGDPQKVATAKLKIRNAIVALILFFFLNALIQFLIPGAGLLAK